MPFLHLLEARCYFFVSSCSRLVLIDVLFLAITDQVMPYPILISCWAASPVSW